MYYCLMDIQALALDTQDNVKLYDDYETALNEFVITPLSDAFGLTGEDVQADYDVELIFDSVTTYDSINGREGFRIARDLTEEAYLRTVEAQRL